MQHIPINQELSQFKRFVEANPRCIFSAKFGDGKTFFLNNFKENYKGEYYTITLHPVNYSVASNEDIFEYIKHDILRQLFQDGLLSDIDYNALFDMALDPEEWKKIIGYLLTLIPKVGDKLAKGLELIDKIKSNYDERKVTFEKYDSFFINQKGSIYERDAYTQLISATINHIHDFEFNKANAKKCILVIEDMDRLDPAHLFRILNIITAHIDEDGNSNKFGFDNIILVMDYDVAESVFHHFYGEGAKFNGYIQKFLSNKPFRFSISEVAYSYFKNEFEKDCGISIDNLDLIHNGRECIKGLVHNLSVRAIAGIIDNKDIFVMDKLMSLESDNNKAIHTKCALSYFLYYCYSIDKNNSLDDEHIAKGVLAMKDATALCKDYFYAIDKFDLPSLKLNTGENGTFIITPTDTIYDEQSKHTVCSNFKIKLVHAGESNNYYNIKELIHMAITIAKGYILPSRT